MLEEILRQPGMHKKLDLTAIFERPRRDTIILNKPRFRGKVIFPVILKPAYIFLVKDLIAIRFFDC